MMTYRARIAFIALSGLLSGTPNAAMAQNHRDSDATAHPHHAHGAPSDKTQEIVVTAEPPVNFGILAATSSVSEDELTRKARAQLGDILSSLPGVSATSFAPGASRPVLRGFGGDRVAILIDGIGSIDASTVSADHAVVFDPLSVEHIDIFHGPAILLFGGNAIGGAVNALDKRIPRKVPTHISGMAMASYGTAADERSAGAALDVPVADRLAARLDASWRESDDLRTGGFLNSPGMRAELLDAAADFRAENEPEEAAEFEEHARLSGRLPNSAARSITMGAGLAFIDAGGDLGISVQRYDTRYGVPLRPGSEHHHDEETHEDDLGANESVSIDLVQTRVDLRGGLKFDGTFDNLQVRGSYGDYRHVEYEGSDVGTRYSGDSIEFRADLIQSERNGWRGRSGIHFADRSLAIDGEEAFTPDYEVGRFGLFTLQSVAIGAGFSLEAAARYENVTIKAREIHFRRSFDLWSAAAGLSWQDESGWMLGLNYVHGARAPSPEELLSDGIHVATQSYELGDPDFGIEKSNGAEAYLRYTTERTHLSLTAFMTDFDGFIATIPSGEEREELPLYLYMQVPARYYGFELSGEVEAHAWDNGSLTVEASADYTHAQLEKFGAAPLIPPRRLRGGLKFQQGNLHAHTEVEWNDRQERTAEFAFPVASFVLVNLGLDWHPFGNNGPLTLGLSADNIFDVVARRAASATRDFVPLPGRDIRVSAKFNF